ncbi:protein of unknown function [Methylorubrum extorquens]|uniref:Uncharacterized protein n=1 Tax=Methylorubrum extorquens TaxID=408 RepID=A0A2N9AYZ5_METEX|nr:protein of unknown function [Methylorubrum extorquens]
MIMMPRRVGPLRMSLSVYFAFYATIVESNPRMID